MDEHTAIATSSTGLFAGSRLCLVELDMPDKSKLLLSGFNHILEVYSTASADSLLPEKNETSEKYQLINSFEIFSGTAIYGIIPHCDGRGNLTVLCFGGRECALLDLIICGNNDNIRNSIQLEKRWNLKFSDWISAAKSLDGNKIILHFATNCVKLLNFDEPSVGRAQNFPETEIQLESLETAICSLLDGHHWEELSLFIGTCFGRIHLFRPAENGAKIVRTFHGNNGMPFSIRCYHKFLFSVGDDRSLRIWARDSGKQLFEKYGHGARPFALELYVERKIIFTAGVDNYFCVWRWTENEQDEIQNLELAKRIDICGIALGTIRAMLPLWRPNSNKTNLFLASDRGTLAKINFNSTISDECSVTFGKMQAFAFSKSGKVHLLFNLDIQRHLSIHQFLDNKLIPLVELSGRVNSELLLPSAVNDGCSKKNSDEFRPDFFAYSSHLATLSLCSQREGLFILKVYSTREFYFCRLNKDISQFHWVQPEETCAALVVEHDGNAILYDLASFQYNSKQSEPIVPKEMCNFAFRPSKQTKNQIQSTLYLQTNINKQTNILLLGTRSGTVLVYCIRQQSAQCVFLLREAHGPNTVTALRMAHIIGQSQQTFNAEIHTLGRDGTQRKWKLSVDGKDPNSVKASMDLHSLHRLHFEWPCTFQQFGCRRLIGGFQSDDFVLLDEQTSSVVWRKRCGGGNRKWQLFKLENSNAIQEEQDENIGFRFAFVQDGKLHLIPITDLIDIQLIKPALHSENIVALASFKHEGKIFILSGSLDRRIVLSGLDLKKISPVLIPNCSIQMHSSSVETICVVERDLNSDKQESLMVSGGGRSELFCWQIDTNTETPKLHFHFMTRLCNEKAADQDTRLISICPISSDFVLVLCSDGTIRFVLCLSKRSFSECARFQIPSLAMFSAIQLQPADQLFFAISTAGDLHLFQCSLLPETKIIQLREPFHVEKCGLSALSIQSTHEFKNKHFLFVGSESGCLSLLICDYPCVESYTEIIAQQQWHSSTITAIQTSSVKTTCFQVFSVALDCRLCIGCFDAIKNQLNVQRLIVLSVSDPAALLVVSRTQDARKPADKPEESQSLFCLISGAGFECIPL